tara:strand:+ start:189 stop:563 length:375 start_codon:yes stop_codon:yes gene_type:complete
MVLPLIAGGLGMYALAEQEKARKEAAAKPNPMEFLGAFAKAIPGSFSPTSKGLNFLQGLGHLGSSIFGPSEESSQKAYLEDIANSPAMQSGAFTNDDLWQQKLKHEQWKKAQGRNYNKDFERFF